MQNNKGGHSRKVFNKSADSILAAFAGANADCLFYRGDENFSIADFTGMGPFYNGLNGRLKVFVVNRNLEFYFFQQVYFVNYTTVALVVAFLLAGSGCCSFGCRGRGFLRREREGKPRQLLESALSK